MCDAGSSATFGSLFGPSDSTAPKRTLKRDPHLENHAKGRIFFGGSRKGFQQGYDDFFSGLRVQLRVPSRDTVRVQGFFKGSSKGSFKKVIITMVTVYGKGDDNGYVNLNENYGFSIEKPEQLPMLFLMGFLNMIILECTPKI